MATKKATPPAPPPPDPVAGAPDMVTCTVLDVLKHNGQMYGPAGNAAGWPDQVELTPAQAAALAAAGVVAASAVAPAEPTQD
ncbi:MAG: hypothetical protein H5U26_11430 [Immundisolibacter sp.]|uniref:hypothetical protein n=1 Tax=Immundisolibacter sp. TaxID=1934948 RepID=UPI00198C2349|nr:hypothetical protein [Immundisolibacter sp.]MBC7162700.1 hypothetical protein [Immundisolibacter sp.]